MKKIGKYQLIAEIKRGRNVITYRGYDTEHERIVLIKVASIPHTSDDPALERFQKESEIYQKIRHPLIARLIEVGLEDIYPYLVLEYVEGTTLRGLLQQFGPLPADICLFALMDLLAGLQHIHEKGLIHRDLKPENLILSNEGKLIICDFDLALFEEDRGEAPRGLTGTVGYFAPEIVYGEPASPASDLFSCGIIAYEMASGMRPFQRDTTDAEIKAITQKDPLPLTRLNPDIPEPYWEITQTLLAKEPAKRPQTARFVQTRFEKIFELPEEPTRRQAMASFVTDPENYQGAEPALREQPQPDARTRRNPLAVPIVLTLAVAVVLGVLFFNRSREPLPETTMAVEMESSTSAEDTMQAFVIPEKIGEQADTVSREPALRMAEPDTVSRTGPTESPPRKQPTPAIPEPRTPGFQGKHIVFRILPWAYVYLDGDSLGLSSELEAQFVEAGPHQLLFRNPRIPPLQIPLQVGPETADTLHIELLDYFGQVFIEVTPWAYVYLDGEELKDLSPKAPLVLRPGRYTLRFIHPNLGSKRKTLVLEAGDVRRLFINMFQQEE